MGCKAVAFSRCGRNSSVVYVVCFRQETACEMRISDWSSDVCSSESRRRGKEIGAHVRRYATFEIAIAGKHSGRDNVITVDRLADRRCQWAAVADAGGAAIADQIEADSIQMLLQASFGKVVGHQLRSDERRVGKEWVSTCRSRWAAEH